MTDRINVWIQKRKNTSKLQLEWLEPETGRRRSKSSGASDPKLAEKLRQDLEYELNHGLHADVGRRSWESFRQIYEQEKLSENSALTRQKAGYVFDRFEREMRPTQVSKITQRTLSTYMAKLRARGAKPATIHGHLAYLKSALQWAVDQRFIASVPKAKMPKLERGMNRAKIQAAARITGEEFERLLMVAPSRDWRLFLDLAWHTGMRRTEAMNVCGEHVNLEGHLIAIPSNKAGDRAATAIITPELDRILRDRFPNGFPEGYLTPTVANDPSGATHRFRLIAKRAGCRGSGKDGQCVLHDLRRNFGSRWAAKVPAQVLQRLMRHSSIQVTLDFYADTEKAALELLWQGSVEVGVEVNDKQSGADFARANMEKV